MNEPKRYTVTSALPYANGSKHIGHLAGAYIPADIYVRLKRAERKDVIFVCGSDENGAAIEIQAKKENTTPKEIVDKYHPLIKECFEKLGISFDVYHRTSEPLHHETAQEFFTDIYNKGLFQEEISEQYFDEKANTFLADRYIIGTCPNCGNDHAYGDQCEKCGKSLSPSDLINPKSTLSDAPPVLRATKHWYLPLDKYENWLKEYILESHKDDWKINTYGQCKSWIDGGLHPRAMTRDLAWGIDVPLKDATGKKLYVWFDAPIGYISATKQLFKERASGEQLFSYTRLTSPVSPTSADDWKLYWQEKDTKLLHFVGKDNIVFHCIIFPLILHLKGDYILANNVPANEFLNLEGDKMSTSRKWSVEMHDYLADFPDKPDALRYCLISNMPETKDSEFTWKDFQLKNNSELVGILGNFINRVLVLTHKYYAGEVPQAGPCSDLQNFITEQRDKIAASIELYRFREAMAEMMNVARHGNKLLTDKEPWKTFKTNPEETKVVLYDSLQIIANLAILCEPFLPFTAAKIFEMLNIDGSQLSWKDAGRQDLLLGGHLVTEPSLLFDKIEDEIIEKQLEKLHTLSASQNQILTDNRQMTNDQLAADNSQLATVVEAQKPEITFDDFAKLDLRLGTILTAEKVEKADKLLKFSVDLGFEIRTIVSGIAAHFKPEELIGQQVSVVANLAPRKIRGIESKGMILLAEDENGKLHFVFPKINVSNGSVIR